MGLFDPPQMQTAIDNTQEEVSPGITSDYAYGLDTHAATEGDRSLFESAADVITKGIPVTGLAIVNSFANTGIELANFLTGDPNNKIDKWSVQAETQSLDRQDLSDYYEEHQQAVEGAGLLIGSLIPGTLAIKGFKVGTAALRAGTALSTAGESSGIIARATGLLPGIQKERIIAQAQKDILNPESLFNSLSSEKYKAIALGFGDQAIQSLIYETATAATMKASPLLDDKSFGDTLSNIGYGALLGGGIGGVIEGIGTRSIFNKMLRTQDVSTKAQQLYSDLGMGNYEAGDKVNTIVHSIYNMPAATSGLGRVYSKMTGDAAVLAAKKELGTLVKNGDEELTNSMFDIIHKMKNENQMSEDDVYNSFARLAKVQRVTDEVAPKIDDGSFYINKRSSAIGQNKVTWSDLVSKDAKPSSDINLRYELKPGAFETQVAKHDDTFFDTEGNPQPMYKSTDDAWLAGNDLFVNPKGDVIVNPKAPNIRPIAKAGESRVLSQAEEISYRLTGKLPEKSEPLFGTQVSVGDKPGATILNVQTGAVTDKVIPTVGDHGSLVFKHTGLKYGDDKFSPQDIGNEITPDTKTIDASARYAWFGARGIRAGDQLSSTDIPALETLYKKINSGEMNADQLKKITIDGDEVPDPSDLVDMIREAKDDQISESIRTGLSSEEAAMRANVPESYIANGMRGKDFILGPESHSTLKHVQLWYDIGNLNQQDGNIIRGIRDTQYRVQLIKTANQDAHAAYFGKDAENYLIKGDTSNAGIVGAPGAGFVKTSSANYNTYAQQFERIGRFISGKNKDDILHVNNIIAPSANALRADPQASAEAGMFIGVRHRTGEAFSFMPPELEAKYIGGTSATNPTGNIAVLDKALIRDKTGKIVDFNQSYIPGGFIDASKIEIGDLPTTASGLRNYYKLSPKVAEWERANQSLNDSRVVARNNFNASVGIQRSLPTGTLYTPPIDTGKYPFIAYIKARPGTGMADDSVAAITAKSQQELQAKIAQLSDQYSVYTKSDIKKYHEVEGDYQYDRNFSDNRVSSELARKGILNDVFPETRGQNIIQKYIDWHSRQVTGLNRDFVELGNAQTFAELREMGDKILSTGTSKTGYISSALEKQVANPYQSYINTALNISPKEQYRTWAFANEKLEAFFSTAFDALKRGFQSARAGVIPYEKASDLAESYGLGKIYENATNPIKAYYNIANSSSDGKALSKFVGAANTILGTGIIRLDAYQSLIHVLSTPMLAAVEAESVKSQILKNMVSIQLPGTSKNIPGTSRLIFNAVKNYWDKDIHAVYGDLYHSIGADKTDIGIHNQMMDQLALPWGSFSQSKMLDKIKKSSELGAKLSGSNWTNTFNHFISADVGRQIFETAGYRGTDLTDQVMTFVNRVQGNYIAGQRPVAFQGPVGQAMGLFQTFGLNMLQSLFRYVENGEAKSLGLLGGLQTSLFGLQGMPGFNFINTHLVGNAAGNPSHDDLYSGIANGLGAGRGSLGDYLLYGVTSNWLNANLYSRGDISPRNITVFPTNPLEFPAIRGGIQIVSNLFDVASKIGNGGDMGTSLLLGLEHNGLNRPLAGLAQMAQGFATNQNGQIIGTTQGANGQSELFSIANFSRLMGARPLDEAAAMGTLSRLGIYTAKDEARINSLGQAVKTELYKNGSLAPEQMENFARDYASRGGNINKFNSAVSRWTTQANAATANGVFTKLKSRGGAQNAMIQMGGIQLPDYLNTGKLAVANQMSEDSSNQVP